MAISMLMQIYENSMKVSSDILCTQFVFSDNLLKFEIRTEKLTHQNSYKLSSLRKKKAIFVTLCNYIYSTFNYK